MNRTNEPQYLLSMSLLVNSHRRVLVSQELVSLQHHQIEELLMLDPCMTGSTDQEVHNENGLVPRQDACHTPCAGPTILPLLAPHVLQVMPLHAQAPWDAGCRALRTILPTSRRPVPPAAAAPAPPLQQSREQQPQARPPQAETMPARAPVVSCHA
jgi:hypothetical protein